MTHSRTRQPNQNEKTDNPRLQPSRALTPLLVGAEVVLAPWKHVWWNTRPPHDPGVPPRTRRGSTPLRSHRRLLEQSQPATVIASSREPPMPTVDPQPWRGGGEDSHSTWPLGERGGRPVSHQGQETRPCPWGWGEAPAGHLVCSFS